MNDPVDPVGSNEPDPFAHWRFASRRVDKPWGHEIIWALSERYCGKILFVAKGQALSRQYHRAKDESWLIQSGSARVELATPDGQTKADAVLGPGATLRYRPGTVHRITALEDTTILEVSTPELDDVVRVEDDYGRVGTSDA